MPKYFQFSRVHGTWTAPIINKVVIRLFAKKAPENKLMSVKTAFDLERVKSRWASKQRLYASTVIWLAFVWKIFEIWVLFQLTSGPN